MWKFYIQLVWLRVDKEIFSISFVCFNPLGLHQVLLDNVATLFLGRLRFKGLIQLVGRALQESNKSVV